MIATGYLCALEHDLGGVVEIGEGSPGEARRRHEHARYFDVCGPWVDAVPWAEAVCGHEEDVDQALDGGEVPAITGQK
jgi:hypothetical protein